MKFSPISRSILSWTVAALAGPAAARAAQDYWVYLGTYTGTGSKGIYVSRMDDAGTLSSPRLVAEADHPAFLALDRTHARLFAVSEVDSFHGRPGGSVLAFSVDPTSGDLKALNAVSAMTPGPDHLCVDATGDTVLVANYDGGSLESYPVGPDGSLGVAASFIAQHGSSVNPKRQAGPHGHCIAVDPGNRFALMCDLGLDEVLLFRLDASKSALTPNDPAFVRAKPGVGPRHMAFGADGRFLYVIDELDCSVTAFAFDGEKGTLSQVQALSALPPEAPLQPTYTAAEVCVHPSGKYLYGSVRGHNSISLFGIDEASGKLSFIANVPSGGKTPRNFNIDPTGRFLLVANQDSGNVVEYSIDPLTGRLTPTGQSLEIEKPVCVVFEPAN